MKTKLIALILFVLICAGIVASQPGPIAPFILRFLDMTDTPSTYTGQAGKYIKVSAGEDAVEFGTPAGAGDLLADGSVPMTANWDIGNFDITLKSLTGDGTIEGATITEGGIAVYNANEAAAWGALHTFNASAVFKNGATSAGYITLYEDSDDGTNYTKIQVVAQAGDIVYSLPPDDGDAGEQLQTDGNGVLTWEAAGGGGDSILINTVAVTDVAGVDFTNGTGITITLNAGASPDTATIASTLGTNIEDAEVDNNITIDLATLATTLTITDNENTAENNPVVFVENGDLDGGNLGLESDGDFYYTPSTGVVTATGFAGALTGNVTGNADTATTATVATTVTITDNENTAENNPLVFVENGDLDGGNLGLESDGDAYYTPSTGKITATGFVGALTGNADTATTATTANAGDSATAFFSAGTIEHEWGGLEANVSAYNGFVKISGGATSAVTANAGTDITADLEEEAHASEHAVGAADTIFPADPDADKYLMWDDVPGALVWGTPAGAGDMTKAVYDIGDTGGVNVITTVDSTYASDYVVLVGAATGQLAPKTDGALTYDSTTGTLAATQFTGGGAGLTGVVGNNEAYAAGWNADTGAPEKDDIYDYLVNFDADADSSFTDETWYTNLLDGTAVFTDLNGNDIIDSDNYNADSIDDEHINWGTGAGQVSSDDVTEGSTNLYQTTKYRQIDLLTANCNPDSTGEAYFDRLENICGNGTNANLNMLALYLADPTADCGWYGCFTIPDDYSDTPTIVIRGELNAVDGTLAFGCTATPGIANDESIDQAYEAEDTGTLDTTVSHADEDAFVVTITMTPGAAYSAGDMVFYYCYRDQSADSLTGAVAVTQTYFRYEDR